jgi:hypothetical protein
MRPYFETEGKRHSPFKRGTDEEATEELHGGVQAARGGAI